MPTYHEIMSTDLSALTTAADRWDGMAAEFEKQGKAYGREVHGIAMGRTWTGLSAEPRAPASRSPSGSSTTPGRRRGRSRHC